MDLSKMSVVEMDRWIAKAPTTDLENERLSLCYDELARRLEAAEAVIAKLPKTADGVNITPGVEIWWPGEDEPEPSAVSWIGIGNSAGMPCVFSEDAEELVHDGFYSTREAAEGARDAQ